jgi:hypothetical protein
MKTDAFELSAGGLTKSKAKSIPFDFIFDHLIRVKPYTKPMFGCTSVYVDDKIVFVLRQKNGDRNDNGVWIATTVEHHESLSEEFPSMRSIRVFGKGPTGWQVLPEESPDFEESVIRACELVVARDPRIGKVPGSKTKKTAVSAKQKETNIMAKKTKKATKKAPKKSTKKKATKKKSSKKR